MGAVWFLAQERFQPLYILVYMQHHSTFPNPPDAFKNRLNVILPVHFQLYVQLIGQY